MLAHELLELSAGLARIGAMRPDRLLGKWHRQATLAARDRCSEGTCANASMNGGVIGCFCYLLGTSHGTCTFV